MAETTTPSAAPPAPKNQTPVVVKKYANRRLYNTETSSYITLDTLAEMIRGGRDFVVYDAKTGEDITRGVLTQIIVEEESKGSALLPTAFLRQLIGFYGDSLQGVVPRYLEHAMASFGRQQQQLRQAMKQSIVPFFPFPIDEVSRQNMAMFERALSLFNPFGRTGEAPAQSPAPAADLPPAPEAAAELDHLRHEIESLREQLAVARADAVMAHAPAATAISAPQPVPPALAAPVPAFEPPELPQAAPARSRKRPAS